MKSLMSIFSLVAIVTASPQLKPSDAATNLIDHPFKFRRLQPLINQHTIADESWVKDDHHSSLPSPGPSSLSSSGGQPTTIKVCPPAYDASAANTYVEGSEVEVGGYIYRCNPFPYWAYCAFTEYKPMSPGELWMSAWQIVSSCVAAEDDLTQQSRETTAPSMFPSSAPSINVAICPPAYDATIAYSYVEGSEVEVEGSIYRCNSFPYDMYCRHPHYQPKLSSEVPWQLIWQEMATCKTKVSELVSTCPTLPIPASKTPTQQPQSITNIPTIHNTQIHHTTTNSHSPSFTVTQFNDEMKFDNSTNSVNANSNGANNDTSINGSNGLVAQPSRQPSSQSTPITVDGVDDQSPIDEVIDQAEAAPNQSSVVSNAPSSKPTLASSVGVDGVVGEGLEQAEAALSQSSSSSVVSGAPSSKPTLSSSVGVDGGADEGLEQAEASPSPSQSSPIGISVEAYTPGSTSVEYATKVTVEGELTVDGLVLSSVEDIAVAGKAVEDAISKAVDDKLEEGIEASVDVEIINEGKIDYTVTISGDDVDDETKTDALVDIVQSVMNDPLTLEGIAVSIQGSESSTLTPSGSESTPASVASVTSNTDTGSDKSTVVVATTSGELSLSVGDLGTIITGAFSSSNSTMEDVDVVASALEEALANVLGLDESSSVNVNLLSAEEDRVKVNITVTVEAESASKAKDAIAEVESSLSELSSAMGAPTPTSMPTTPIPSFGGGSVSGAPSSKPTLGSSVGVDGVVGEGVEQAEAELSQPSSSSAVSGAPSPKPTLSSSVGADGLASSKVDGGVDEGFEQAEAATSQSSFGSNAPSSKPTLASSVGVDGGVDEVIDQAEAAPNQSSAVSNAPSSKPTLASSVGVDGVVDEGSEQPEASTSQSSSGSDTPSPKPILATNVIDGGVGVGLEQAEAATSQSSLGSNAPSSKPTLASSVGVDGGVDEVIDQAEAAPNQSSAVSNAPSSKPTLASSVGVDGVVDEGSEQPEASTSQSSSGSDTPSPKPILATNVIDGGVGVGLEQAEAATSQSSLGSNAPSSKPTLASSVGVDGGVDEVIDQAEAAPNQSSAVSNAPSPKPTLASSVGVDGVVDEGSEQPEASTSQSSSGSDTPSPKPILATNVIDGGVGEGLEQAEAVTSQSSSGSGAPSPKPTLASSVGVDGVVGEGLEQAEASPSQSSSGSNAPSSKPTLSSSVVDDVVGEGLEQSEASPSPSQSSPIGISVEAYSPGSTSVEYATKVTVEGELTVDGLVLSSVEDIAVAGKAVEIAISKAVDDKLEEGIEASVDVEIINEGTIDYTVTIFGDDVDDETKTDALVAIVQSVMNDPLTLEGIAVSIQGSESSTLTPSGSESTPASVASVTSNTDTGSDKSTVVVATTSGELSLSVGDLGTIITGAFSSMDVVASALEEALANVLGLDESSSVNVIMREEDLSVVQVDTTVVANTLTESEDALKDIELNLSDPSMLNAISDKIVKSGGLVGPDEPSFTVNDSISNESTAVVPSGFMGRFPPYLVITVLSIGIIVFFIISVLLIRSIFCKRRVIDGLVLLEEGNLNDHDEVEIAVALPKPKTSVDTTAYQNMWDLPGIGPESIPEPLDRTLTVHSPPGTLGIVLKNSARGPMIHHVNSDSRVLGQLFVGDIITVVNKLDVATWDSRYLSKFLNTNANTGKILTVIRTESSDSSAATTSTQSHASTADENESVGTKTSKKPMKRTVLAPPGALGILLTDSAQGPTIQSVKQGSAMQGKLFEGDVITSVNDVDVSAWESRRVTKFLKANLYTERSLKVYYTTTSV